MSTLEEQTAAADAYEQLMVPALFRQWPPRLLDAVGAQPGMRILDVACGTGIVAREALSRVGEGGRVSGIDPGAGMLAVARRAAPAVEWREGVAESLPYADHSFDAVVSQFGLMFFSDREAALKEMLRVLTPGGALAVAVWDSLSNSDGYREEVELLDRLAGPDAVHALSAPFCLGDITELAAMFERSGAVSVDVATVNGTARFPSIRTMVEADLRGWLPIMGVALDEAKIEQILDEAKTVLAPYVVDGKVVFSCPAHIVTARRAN